MAATVRYIQPDAFTQKVFNPTVRFLTRHGVSLRGSRELRVVGRKSGQIRTTAVNLLTMGDRAYLEKWEWEVGKFFEGLTKDATDDEIAAVATGFPVFALERV